jgi:type III secretion protein L
MSTEELAGFVRSRALIKASDFERILSIEAIRVQAESRAQAVVTQARLQAERIRAEAQESSERLEAAARLRGHQLGLLEAKEFLAQSVIHNQGALAQSWRAQEQKLSHLVIRTLEKILTHDEAQTQFFDSVVRRVILAAREQRFLVFKVAAGQLELVRSRVAQALAQHGAPCFVEVQADPDLSVGACLIETGYTQIDASLGTQLQALQRALSAVFARNDTGDNDNPEDSAEVADALQVSEATANAE